MAEFRSATACFGESRAATDEFTQHRLRARAARLEAAEEELRSEVVRVWPGPWRSGAACKGSDEEGPLGRFFHADPEDLDRPRVEVGRGPRAKRAREICAGCPVLVECQHWALFEVGPQDRDSILGGMSWMTRKDILTTMRWEVRDRPKLDQAPGFERGNFSWEDWREVVVQVKSVVAARPPRGLGPSEAVA